jgi:hypothetical protein
LIDFQNLASGPATCFHTADAEVPVQHNTWRTRAASRAKNLNLTLLQAQLRAFIPLMLKYNIIHGKAGRQAEQKTNLTSLQAQLRAFIPLMKKYKTVCGKPGRQAEQKTCFD